MSIGLLIFGLPIAISFYTFQQIAYLVDSYHGETKKDNFLDYAIFVTFFPKLLAGPDAAKNTEKFAKIKIEQTPALKFRRNYFGRCKSHVFH